METSIQSNVFTLRPLGPSQEMLLPPRFSSSWRILGRILEVFVLETCEPEGSGAEMVPPPLYFSTEKYFECRIRTCHVVRWCVPGVCAASP